VTSRRKPERRLLVAVHDVTPAHAKRLERVFALLDELSIRQFALFVVPDWHGRWPLERHGKFVKRLRALAKGGCEIVLHGLRHDEVGTRRSAAGQVLALGRTAGEAEFLSLDGNEMRARIRKGLDKLRQVGLEPTGFVPPAWLAGSELDSVLSGFRFAFTEDDQHVRLLADGRSIRAPAIRWSTRKRWRAAAGVAIAACRVPLERRYQVRRIAIHPTDTDVPAVVRSVRRIVVKLSRWGRLSAYRELASLPDVVA
jgi:predicted deacetylase